MDALSFIDIVLDGGDLVRVEIPVEHFDAFMDDLDNARRRNDWLSAALYDGVKFNYLGHNIDRVNGSKIVALF
jgi:hypothetical protein